MGAIRPASIEEALRYCLDNPEGLSTEELLDKFPEYRQELEPLLALDAGIRAAASQTMPPGRELAMQARIMRAAIARQSGTVASDGQVDEPVVLQPRADRAPWWRRNRRWAGAVATTLAITLVWWLSATSLPDSFFYPVKLTTENLLLNFSRSPAGALRGHVGLANIRLGDITTMRLRNRLGLAAPALENYSYHMDHCLRLWQTEGAPRDTDLASLLYASSVAGDYVFAGIGQGVNDLPERLRANLQETSNVLQGLNTSTGEYLRQAGFDLGQVLQTSDPYIVRFLTPVPGVPTPAPTPEAAPSPTLPATAGAAGAEPTLTAVLWSAQTAISDGGDSTTPVFAAAETVIAGGTGTPMAQAIQTLLAYSTATAGLVPTLTAVPTVTPAATGGPATLTVTIPAHSRLTPGVPVTPPDPQLGRLTPVAGSTTSPVVVPSVTPAIPGGVELTVTVPLPTHVPQVPEVSTPGVSTPTLPLP